jgi:hypothetical protein
VESGAIGGGKGDAGALIDSSSVNGSGGIGRRLLLAPRHIQFVLTLDLGAFLALSARAFFLARPWDKLYGDARFFLSWRSPVAQCVRAPGGCVKIAAPHKISGGGA